MPPKRRGRDFLGSGDDDDSSDPTQPKIDLFMFRGRGAGGGGRGGGDRATGRGRGRGNGSPLIKANTPCKFFTGAPGSCKDGDFCPYKHADELTFAHQNAGGSGGGRSNNNNNDMMMMMMNLIDDVDPLSPSTMIQLPNAAAAAQSLLIVEAPRFCQQLAAAIQRQPLLRQQHKPAGGSFRSVRVPWDPAVTYQCKHTQQQRPVWSTYQTFLRERCASEGDVLSMLSELVSVGANKKRPTSSFPALSGALRSMPDDDFLNKKFLPRILPKLQDYVLAAPLLFPDPIPILQQRPDNINEDVASAFPDKVVLTQLQCTVLLAVGFFGLFPQRVAGDCYREDPPGCNLSSLYGSSAASQQHKVKCLLGYFDTVTDETVSTSREKAALAAAAAAAAAARRNKSNSGTPLRFGEDDEDDDDDEVVGIEASSSSVASTTTYNVEFIRIRLDDAEAVFDEMLESTKPLSKVDILEKGVIESNNSKMVQADFANRVIGGGVLGGGCVQEEIRFVISPELLLTRLVVEDMLDDEAVMMSGTLIYCRYVGYGYQFQYAGRVWPLPPPTPEEARAGMRDVAVIAFDAINFSPKVDIGPQDQFRLHWVQRELLKAYVAFLPVAGSQCPSARLPERAIATGNWGCGVFRGDLELKFAVQLIAASQAGRSVCYYPFGQNSFADGAVMFMEFLEEKGVDDAQTLLHLLVQWSKLHEAKMDADRRKMESDFDLPQSGGSKNNAVNLLNDDDDDDDDDDANSNQTMDYDIDKKDDAVSLIVRANSSVASAEQLHQELGSFFYFASRRIEQQESRKQEN